MTRTWLGACFTVTLLGVATVGCRQRSESMVCCPEAVLMGETVGMGMGTSMSSGFYAEVRHNGRIYVLGSYESKAEFEEMHHMPYTQTHIGAGPEGESVVVEVDKKNPETAERLWEEYKRRHPLYKEVEKDGRIYVIGTYEMYDDFLTNGHMPYTQTQIGAGPEGESIVVQVEKDDPDFADKLWQKYKEHFYAEYEHDGRIYVIGDPDTAQEFRQMHHLPYTQTHIGAGPKGETVVLEVDKGNPDFVEALWQKYTDRFYAEYEHNGRVYVIGDPDTAQDFRQMHHLPYTQTHIGAGAGGKTVVIEVNKKKADFAAKLASRYEERHNVTLD